jgi:hypothetical protein
VVRLSAIIITILSGFSGSDHWRIGCDSSGTLQIWAICVGL